LDGSALLQAGKRIVTLKRLLNVRRGLSRKNDRLPDLLLQPLAEGGTEGRVPDVEALLRGAYEEYGWDPCTGRPLPETLELLGLESLNA
jgi:aldehyde:ferredoxin oxidoreductase